MGIGQSQCAHDVEEVEAALESVEDSPIGILEITPVSGEVVVAVGEGVHDELDRDAGNHHYTQDRRAFFHGIIVFEDEPLGPDSNAEGQYEEHQCYGHVDFRADGFCVAQVVLAPTEHLDTVHTHLYDQCL